MTTLTNERPAGPELIELYDAVGWTAYAQEPERLIAAIDGSHAVFTARNDEGVLVGLARTVSDGATICYLQDILVHPDAHRTGVGRALLTAVLDRYAQLRQFVLLTDDDSTQRAFYTSLGLVRSDGLGLYAYLRS